MSIGLSRERMGSAKWNLLVTSNRYLSSRPSAFAALSHTGNARARSSSSAWQVPGTTACSSVRPTHARCVRATAQGGGGGGDTAEHRQHTTSSSNDYILGQGTRTALNEIQLLGLRLAHGTAAMCRHAVPKPHTHGPMTPTRTPGLLALRSGSRCFTKKGHCNNPRSGVSNRRALNRKCEHTSEQHSQPAHR